jgi:hypothetical protein
VEHYGDWGKGDKNATYLCSIKLRIDTDYNIHHDGKYPLVDDHIIVNIGARNYQQFSKKVIKLYTK